MDRLLLEELNQRLNMSLYGDDGDYIPPTRWQRYLTYWRGFPERARDAWLVLKGEAFIYDD